MKGLHYFRPQRGRLQRVFQYSLGSARAMNQKVASEFDKSKREAGDTLNTPDNDSKNEAVQLELERLLRQSTVYPICYGSVVFCVSSWKKRCTTKGIASKSIRWRWRFLTRARVMSPMWIHWSGLRRVDSEINYESITRVKGRDSVIRIDLPKGSYVPAFQWRQPTVPATVAAPD